MYSIIIDDKEVMYFSNQSKKWRFDDKKGKLENLWAENVLVNDSFVFLYCYVRMNA